MEKRKILVIDDEPDFLQMIRMRLEANNYQVLTALSGKAGLNIIKKDKPDAVLLDILMPEMDGLTLLKKIRKGHKGLPVFIITAFSNQERFKLANNLGASGFIVKTDDLGFEDNNITATLNLAKRYKGKT
jgi:DNA-binding response OmpR family regulator